MTDAEISRRLALAIGWDDEKIEDSHGCIICRVGSPAMWQTFDYRDPAVIWPIAERFDCFPKFHAVSDTWAVSPGQWMANQDADTAAKAVALAVIKSKGSGK